MFFLPRGKCTPFREPSTLLAADAPSLGACVSKAIGAALSLMVPGVSPPVCAACQLLHPPSHGGGWWSLNRRRLISEKPAAETTLQRAACKSPGGESAGKPGAAGRTGSAQDPSKRVKVPNQDQSPQLSAHCCSGGGLGPCWPTWSPLATGDCSVFVKMK